MMSPMTAPVAELPSASIGPHPAFRLPVTPAGRLHHQIRLQWPVTRPELAESTGLSQPTVARGVKALIEAGLIAERPDLITGRGGGRPRVPLAPTEPPWLHVGAHLGLKTTRLAIFDTVGRVLRETELPLELDVLDAAEALDHVIAGIHRLRTGLVRPLRTAGVALAGHVAADGTVTSRSYGWERFPLVNALSDGLGIPALAAPHVAAMAASELGVTPLAGPAASGVPAGLYFYARELIGVAWTVDGGVHRPAHGDGTIGHLPVGGSDLLQGDTLQEALGGSGVLAAARAGGVDVADLGELVAVAAHDPFARAVLDERARLLGEAVATVADVVDPAHVVLAGSAFTDDAPGLRIAARTIARRSPVRRDIRLSRARGNITRDAARAVALDPLHSDPLSLA